MLLANCSFSERNLYWVLPLPLWVWVHHYNQSTGSEEQAGSKPSWSHFQPESVKMKVRIPFSVLPFHQLEVSAHALVER
jgi:hypothetical protein